MEEIVETPQAEGPPAPSGGRRALLIFSFVLWFIILAMRFVTTGESRKERTPAANPILAGLAGKLLDISSYVDTLSADPNYKVLGTMHAVDQLRGYAEDELKQALNEAPNDLLARCKAIIVAGHLKRPEVKSMLAEATRETDKQRDFKPLVDTLAVLYGTGPPPTVPETADVLRTYLSGWFRDAALLDLYHRQAAPDGAQIHNVEQEMAHLGERAFGFLLAAGSLIVVNFIGGCILLILLPFFHRVADLRTPDNTPRWWWGTGWMVYVWFMVVEVGVGLLYLVANRGHADAYTITSVVVVQIVVYTLSIAGVVWMVRNEPGVRWRQLGIHGQHLFRCIFLGIGSYLCALPCIVVVGMIQTRIMKQVPTSQNGVFSLFAHPPSGAQLLALLLLVCVVGPLFEELVFRGVLYGSLRQVMPRPAAMVVSAAIFALVHADLPALLPIFILALFMAFVFEKTGSLVPSAVMHMMQNTTTFIFTLFLVS